MGDSDDPLKLARKVVQLAQEFGEVDDDEENLADFKEKKRGADTLISRGGNPGEALQAAMVTLDAMLRMNVNSIQAHLVKARVREIMWMIKDTIALCGDAGDKNGKAIALQALARAHLVRSDEPDAPTAALKAIKEAVRSFQELGDMKKEADALCVAGDAHLHKSFKTPFEKAAADAIEAAAQATKDAAALYKKLGDKKGEGAAMHTTALALLSLNDDDKMMDGERYADDARELLRSAGARSLEAQAVFTIIKIRLTTSGPEAALMLAKDAVEDWRSDGNRHEHEAAALHKCAELHIEHGELDEALKACKDAQGVYAKTGKKRGLVGVLCTIHQVNALKNENDAAFKVLKEAISICQEIKDKRAEGNTLTLMASLLLGNLIKDVEVDSNAVYQKKDPVVGITTDDVYQRGELGLDYAGKAFECFEDMADEAGMARVQDVIQSCFQRGIDLYAGTNEPDHITTTLDVEQPTTKKSKFEWKVTVPRSKQLAGGDGGAGQIVIQA